MFANHCSSCRHFHVDAKNLKQGKCIRFPPQAFAVAMPNGRGMVEGSIVPTVQRDYGCGEHSAAKPGDELPVLGATSPIGGEA
jgi:hypothetical protein